MKFRFVRAGAVACLAAAATAAGLAAATAGPASAAVTAHHAIAKPVQFDCLNHPVVKPANYILACADAGSVLAHLSWSSWSAEQAVATGVHQLNNCTPNCAEGRFVNYPAVITFWRPEPLAGHPGGRYFTRVTVRYTTASRPPMYMNYNRLVNHPAQWSEVLGS